VSTSAARIQDISLNPQKLAGQCGKLKCCMNFEVDTYVDALKGFPSKEVQLETADNTYYHFKTDVFKALISYSTSPNFGANVVTISPKRAKEIIAMNKKGSKPDLLDDHSEDEVKPVVIDYENGVGQDSLTRFDTQKKRPANKPSNNNRRPNQPQPTKTEQPNKVDNKPRFEKPIKKNDVGEKND